MLAWLHNTIQYKIHLKTKIAVCIMSLIGEDHHTDGLFQELEILPLDKFIKLRYGKFMWRLNNGFVPESLASNFPRNRRTQISKQHFLGLNHSHNLCFLQAPSFGMNFPLKLPTSLVLIVSQVRWRIILWGNPSPAIEIVIGPIVQTLEIALILPTIYQILPIIEE